jgi:Asp-tRNA(Asn)/Glu-tRNA(Gln) amidotransferase A subunit family amidase
VPGLTGPNGLPVGVQVVGRDEAAVLAAAARLEAALEGGRTAAG